jgi:ATP-dependent helicase/nuclease subunit B
MNLNKVIPYLFGYCAKRRLEKKYLIAPSYQIAHQLGEALAEEGGSWVNLHFMTLPALAQQVVGAELSKQGIKFISSTGSLFLVDKIFRRVKDEAKLDYFDKIEATTGIVRALQNSLIALRMAGLKSTDLRSLEFIKEQKGKEVILLLQAYEDELDKGKLIDLAGLYELALKRIGARRKEKELYLAFQDRPLGGLEREFLQKIAGENLFLIPQDPVFGLVRPRRLWKAAPISTSPSIPPSTPTPSPATDVERLPWLFATKDAPPPLRDNTLDIFSAIGPTNECREILRRIISEKIPFDDVEIIHPSGPSYPSIMFALAAKAGFKVTFGDGIPLAFTAPGKVFSGLVEWMEHDFLVTDLCALIEAGVIKLPSGNDHVALAPLKASRYLKSAMIGWGRERYVARLQTLIQDADERARAAEDEGEFGKIGKYRENIREVESLIAFVKNMLEPLPEEDEEGKIDFAALSQGIASFIGKFSSVYGDLDAEARGLLQSRLEEAAAFKTSPLKRQAVFEWLKNVAEGLRVGASGPAPGHLHLSNWRAGGYSSRPVTFVVGLDQGTFPGGGIQDPILLDEERERISGELMTSADTLRENLWATAAMLAGLRGKVVLSYSSYDVIEERQSFPSSLILQAARLREGNPGLDYSALAGLIPEARGFLPGGEGEERKGRERGAQVIDETDWWLGKLAPGGVLRDGMDAVKANFDLLSRGIFALEKRGREKVGEFEGKIKIDPKEVHPLHNKDIVMSASRFERLARCPFGYLMRYVLDVMPPDELELDSSKWLDPMQRGSLLHEVFALFMEELGKRGEAANPKKHAALIRKIGAGIIARYREEIPPPSEGIFERERKAIEEELEVFLKAEAGRLRPVEPVLFEVSFGTRRKEKERKGSGGKGRRDGQEDVEEAAGEAVMVKCGEEAAFRLAGRIDRIDRIEKSLYRVIDYKTGSSSPFESFKSFGKGKILQHALYALAAEEILRRLKIDGTPSVVESGYYFPTRKGEGKEITVEKFSRSALGLVLGELLQVLEKGRFVASPEAECDFCEYGPICGGLSARDRAKEKREQNQDVFDMFKRLKQYE